MSSRPISDCILLHCVGILVAGCINLGAKDIDPWGWRLPLAIAGAFCFPHCQYQMP